MVEARACKALYLGSIPSVASIALLRLLTAVNCLEDKNDPTE